MANHPAGGQTIIAQGVKVEGDFTSQGDVVIDGEFSGTLSTSASLKIGEAAKIRADVTAQSATVAGEVQGNVRVSDRLDLLEGSRVSGDVQAQVLSVAAGAKVNGHVSMDGASAPASAPFTKGKKAREEVEA